MKHTDEVINEIDLSILLMDELRRARGPRRGSAAGVLAELRGDHIGVASLLLLLGSSLGYEADLVGTD